MAVLQYIADANFQTATLNTSYTSGGVSLVLTGGHGARFPSSGNFYVRVDDEILKCTSRSTDTLTVVGAQDGTSASNHSAGATVRWVLSASALDQMRADIVRIGTVANLPASGSRKQGDLYFTSDGVYQYVFDGSVWVPFYQNFKVTEPVSGDFSWVNQGGATISTAAGGALLEAPTSAGINLRMRVKSQPSTPYTITAIILPYMINSANFPRVGLVFRESGTSKIITWGFVGNGEPGILSNERWTNETTFSVTQNTYNSGGHRWARHQPILLWMSNNGTNLTWGVATVTGKAYTLKSAESKSAFFTTGPDQVGFVVEVGQTSTYEAGGHLVHWKET